MGRKLGQAGGQRGNSVYETMAGAGARWALIDSRCGATVCKRCAGVTTLNETDQPATDRQPDGHQGRPGTLDAVAFRQLALDQIDSVYRMAFHLARNGDDASDLTQETYLRAFKAEAGFELRERGIRPWLFKILHNVFYTKIARAKRDPLFVETLEYDAADDDQTISTHSWDLEALDWEQLDERLKHAIEELPAHYCQALLLWAVEGLRYREVADVLDIPIGTVMSRLYRARSILSEQLAELAAEHGINVEPAAKRTTKRSEAAQG